MKNEEFAHELARISTNEISAPVACKRLRLCVRLFILVLLSSCYNLINDKIENQHTETESITEYEIPAGYGLVHLNLTQGEARTAVPSDILDNVYLEFIFNKNGTELASEYRESGGIYDFLLETDDYSLKINVYTASDKLVKIADGSSGVFTVLDGKLTDNVPVQLRPFIPVSGTDTGGFEITLQYPSGVTIETLTLKRFLEDTPFYDLKPASTPALTYTAAQSGIPVGYYWLTVQLRNASGAYTGGGEIVHIYKDRVTKTLDTKYEFTTADFVLYTVTNTNDSGPGSLRQAITDTLPGQTIFVSLPPGSVIELESALPDITKNLYIEGNGVTITSSWTAGIDTQVFRVNNNVEVNISRIHFKGIRSTKNATAIYNNANGGTVTLKSCIFSGNVSGDGSTGFGGAIRNLGSMNIIGCTFYDNTADRGGAISTEYPAPLLVLMGNLFYGNKDGNRPVVYNNGSTIISDGYNVVDIPFGTGINQCGWENTTGNDYYTTTPSISTSNFKVITGSPADGIIPAP